MTTISNYAQKQQKIKNNHLLPWGGIISPNGGAMRE